MIREIQYLRGIAAAMVVLFHTIPQLRRMGYTGPEFEVMSYGVDIFFVISGFIMTYISIDSSTNWSSFIKNRIIRIVPIYWLLTTFIAVLGVALPFLLQSTQVDLNQYIKSLLFIPYIHPISQGYFPLLQPGWTLNYEMYFYLVFALFIGIRGDSKYFLMIIALTVATTALSQIQHTTLSFYGSTIILEFCLGILLGYTYVRHAHIFQSRNTLGAGIITTLSGFTLLFTMHSILPTADRLIVAGLPSLLIIAGALLLANAPLRLISKTMEKIGDSSYSLYLSHGILLSALGQIFRKVVYPQLGEITYIIFPIVALISALIFGYIFYFTIERTLTQYIKDKLKTKVQVKAPAL